MELNQPHDLDEALARILAEPSTAARIALATADILDDAPHLTINAYALGCATSLAFEHVTTDLPAVVADEALRAVVNAMPVPRTNEYCDEYALRIRNLVHARGL